MGQGEPGVRGHGLTYFQPKVVLQFSQWMSATAWRPVSSTRSSAGPQPTFTLRGHGGSPREGPAITKPPSSLYLTVSVLSIQDKGDRIFQLESGDSGSLSVMLGVTGPNRGHGKKEGEPNTHTELKR